MKTARNYCMRSLKGTNQENLFNETDFRYWYKKFHFGYCNLLLLGEKIAGCLITNKNVNG